MVQPYCCILKIRKTNLGLDKRKTIIEEDEELLSRIRIDADAGLREVYRRYRNPFHAWATSAFLLDESTISDLFQEVVIAFYKNVISKKLHTLDASLKTYLFAIGKYQILNRYRQKQKENTQYLENFDQLKISEWDLNVTYLEEQSSKEEKIVAALGQLGEKCRQLLKLFYFDSLSHQEVAARLGYKSVEVSRSMKRKCMNQLRQLFA